ncbi:hypothetical protein E4Z66_11225 [Aliishimia ponticola]|uniref:Translation initiation factor 2 n=1 Tax=Aliishimia ponticola TaxID=2499833 RepID=A0A4S4NHT4_9RHOB|nr:hypothetical protein [Aliishimia ponticola]THH35660.1 hypothetical protein E4Z66_11225 [Aliishimia ponticola]
MKANFALSLSFEGIRLLHRAAGGWRPVDEVNLSDPDLGTALAALRRTALALEPSGLRTKLIIPGSQIRYLTIDTAGMAPDQLEAAARDALNGATPYAVEELAFDLSPDGDQTHIAAVALETLAEAEAFAVEHRFAPISVVAVPEGEPFLGEPFFGATRHAQTLLAPGETVEADGIAVVVLDPVTQEHGPVVEVEETAPVVDVDDTGPPPDGADPAGSAPDEAAPPLVLEDNVAAPATNAAPDQAEEPSAGLKRAAPEDDTPPQDAEPEEGDTGPALGFASRRTGADAQSAAPQLGGVTRRFTPTTPAAPGDRADAAAEADPASDVPPVPPPPVAPETRASTPPLRDAGVLDAGLPGLEDEEPPTPQLVTPPAAPDEAAAGPKKTRRGKLGGLARKRARTEPDATPEAQGAAPATQTIAADRATPTPHPKSERQRMTVFGARKPEADVAVAKKPRFLGLILTAILLLFLAMVAAWSMVFQDGGLAGFFSPRAAPEQVETAAPAPAPAPPSTIPDIEDLPPPLETASLAAPVLPPEVPGSLLAEPEPPAAFDPAEAEAQYAVTGIWAIPPAVPLAPGLLGLDSLYMTSIDPANLSFDAVALLPGASYGTDGAFRVPGNPAPPGTAFTLDPSGRVTPTPDGAVSPDGVTVYQGRPPLVAPPAPREDPAAPLDRDVTPEGEAATLALAAFRPRVRPKDLIENNERTQLGGLSRSELAQIRPRIRPRSQQETEQQAQDEETEEEAPPSALAVAASLRPENRPRNFDRAVARARAAQEPEEPQQVAAVAPRTVQPRAPSKTSVTREATVKNAINLRRINLMGVYGTPSNRRALVRLSNGRYKKVKVGDRIDGGRVSAIGDSELSYRKGARNIVLRMPKT